MKRAARSSFGCDGSDCHVDQRTPALKFSHPIKAKRRGNSNSVCWNRAWLKPMHHAAKSLFFRGLSRAAGGGRLGGSPAEPRPMRFLRRPRGEGGKAVPTE